MSVAFITGAAGFYGRNLIQQLLEQGWDIVALCRDQHEVEKLAPWDVNTVIGDVSSLKSMRAAMPSAPDVVFHLAANSSLWRGASEAQTLCNVVGTRQVARVALEKNAGRLVHTSSITAYGIHTGTITEQTPSRAASSKINYVRSKVLSEKEIRKAIKRGLDAVILNPSNTLGPYDDSIWSRLFLMAQKGVLPGMPGGGCSFCHVKPVVSAHISAAEKGRTGQNYLLGGANSTYVNLYREIGRRVGRRVLGRPLPRVVLNNMARADAVLSTVRRREPNITPEAIMLLSAQSYCSSAKAVKELDYQPETLQKALDDAYDWLVEQGLLRAEK